jgi:prephenate dehydrogenase
MLERSAATDDAVLVVGTGLIGTSIALALREQGREIWLQDEDPVALGVAVQRGAGAALPAGPVAAADAGVALVIVCVPPSAAASVIATSLRTHINATVSDVASTKARLQAEVEALVEHSSDVNRYVPGHPMAGREVSGPAAARADLFADRVWALTPTVATDPVRTAAVVALVASLGAVSVVTTAEEHDRAVALTSHTPQVVASTVAAGLAGLGETGVRLSGQGLRDVTRLAASDPLLWSDILTSNADPVADALDALIARLGTVRDGLREGAAGTPKVRRALEDGVAGYLRVPGKHGTAPVAWAVVSVSVADRPGELGRLFADAGSTGVNLEDVRIEHAQGRPTGLVELEVAPGSAEALAQGLRAAGWDVRA